MQDSKRVGKYRGCLSLNSGEPVRQRTRFRVLAVSRRQPVDIECSTRSSTIAIRFARLAILLALMITGCGAPRDADTSTKEPDVPEAPAVSESPRSNSSAGPRVGPFVLETDGLAFDVPDGWREVELDEMARDFVSAKVTIPGSSPGDALTISFSTASGGIAANVARWRGQFPQANPEIEELSINQKAATWVDIRGDFQAGVGGGPQVQSDWRMLGVAIPLSPRDFYIKLTGPRERVNDVYDSFREMVISARTVGE